MCDCRPYHIVTYHISCHPYSDKNIHNSAKEYEQELSVEFLIDISFAIGFPKLILIAASTSPNFHQVQTRVEPRRTFLIDRLPIERRSISRICRSSRTVAWHRLRSPWMIRTEVPASSYRDRMDTSRWTTSYLNNYELPLSRTENALSVIGGIQRRPTWLHLITIFFSKKMFCSALKYGIVGGIMFTCHTGLGLSLLLLSAFVDYVWSRYRRSYPEDTIKLCSH